MVAQVQSFSIMGVVVLLAMLVAALLCRWIVDPLTKLAGVTGNLPRELMENNDICRPDIQIREIGFLMNNFQSMSDTLRQYFDAFSEQKTHLAESNAELEREIEERKRAQDDLRESTRILITLIRNLPGMAFRCLNDAGWTMKFVSQGCKALTGYDAADLIDSRRLTFSDLIHEDNRERVASEIRKAAGEKKAYEVTYLITAADGTEKCVWEKGCGVFSREGDLTCLEGFMTDITETKRVLDSLQESEEKFRTLMKNAPDSIFIQTEGRFAFLNEAAVRLYGADSESDLLGSEIKERLHPDSLDSALERMRLINDRKTVPLVEQKHMKMDGTELVVEVSSIPFGYGGTNGGLVFIRDVTERKRAERKLLESEERFRQLAEHIREVFWITDALTSRTLYVSPAYEEVWGRSCGSLYTNPRSSMDPVHPDDKERLSNCLAEAHGEAFSVEYRIVRPDGSTLWIHERGFPVRNEAGEIYRFAGISEDVTDRKLTEESNAFLASIVEFSNVGIIGMNLGGEIVSWNGAAERIYGFREEEMKGRDISILYPPDRLPEISKNMNRIRRGAPVNNFETVRLKKSGEPVYVALTISPIRGRGQEVVGASVIVRDISERKWTEQALSETEERFRITFENAGIGMALCDLDGHPVRSNPALQEMLGYSGEELAGMTFADFTHPDDIDLDWRILEELLAGRLDQCEIEKRYITRDGRVIWGGLTVSMVRNAEGKPMYLISMSRTSLNAKEWKDPFAKARSSSGRWWRALPTQFSFRLEAILLTSMTQP